jgi:hypothetical protein
LRVSARTGRPQRLVALTADNMLGPYRLVEAGVRPLGMDAGDFDIAVDPQDGKAYCYFERVHRELVCADLTPDHTGFTGYYSTHFPRPRPPWVREAPAQVSSVFRHPDKQDLYIALADRWLPDLAPDAPHAGDVLAHNRADVASRLLQPYGYGTDPDTS